uniref:BTB/POZ domain-containing protein At3g19850 n=1 Tax=Anthurium amnicola TaxID=1678845 RepID=A0A1D1XPP0_9ARAE
MVAQSHTSLSLEERSRLCRCLNYEKLTLEACKDLAKSPRIPPRSAVQALASQRVKLQDGAEEAAESPVAVVAYHRGVTSPEFTGEKEELRHNLQMMQWRVAELEKVCREMRGQMSRIAKSGKLVISSPSHLNGRGLPRLC